MTKEREWCWRLKGQPEPWGPFPTRDAVLADVRKEAIGAESVIIGRVRWVDPSGFVPDVMGAMLDKMDTQAAIQYSIHDGVVFEAKENAEQALSICLRDWAKAWIEPRKWVMEEEEEIRFRYRYNMPESVKVEVEKMKKALNKPPWRYDEPPKDKKILACFWNGQRGDHFKVVRWDHLLGKWFWGISGARIPDHCLVCWQHIDEDV